MLEALCDSNSALIALHGSARGVGLAIEYARAIRWYLEKFRQTWR
ncbi:hypothetical protein [Serratia symbiotica]|nr:hypothetical protein [Serratia symbiotica]